MWFKLDDNGWCHAKVLAAGNESYGAWCRAGQWSSGQLTSGFIPEAAALVIAPLRVWKKLESCGGPGRAGLVDRVDGGWQLHDFLMFNPDGESVRASREATSEKRREAGRKGMAKRWDKDGNLPNKTITTPYQTYNPVPVPVPVPVPGVPPVYVPPPAHGGVNSTADPEPGSHTHNGDPQVGGGDQSQTQMPSDWAPTESHGALARRLGRDLQREADAFRDYCLAHGKRYVSWDAAFANWIRSDKYRGEQPKKPSAQRPQRERGAYPVQNTGAYVPDPDAKPVSYEAYRDRPF